MYFKRISKPIMKTNVGKAAMQTAKPSLLQILTSNVTSPIIFIQDLQQPSAIKATTGGKKDRKPPATWNIRHFRKPSL
jgi:hypothetical protein